MEVPTFFGILAQKISKLHGLAYGFGIISNVAHAYSFLMDSYEAGDKVFVFGFSRGAYTARVLCSMLYEFGLLEKGNQVLIEYAMSLFTNATATNSRIAKHFKETFGRDCKPHFVGVWDTVSSVGWVYDPLALAFTNGNPEIHIGRQAVAIDERRCYFRPNLWHECTDGQDLKQVWFTGVHSDIGGGYPRRQSGLSNISLKWMMDEAQVAGLQIDEKSKEQIFIDVPMDSFAPIHRSLHDWWWIPEYLPKQHEVREGEAVKKEWEISAGRPRCIPENSILHQSVIDRLNHPAVNYHPPNLPKSYRIEPSK